MANYWFLCKLLEKSKILSISTSIVRSTNNFCFSNKNLENQNVKFGIMFDIDGVLLRGDTPISEAKNAITSLVNNQSHEFLVPSLFCTNAFGMEEIKAATLSKCFNILIRPNQIVMSQTPLESFRELRKKCCFVSGPDHDGGAVKVAQRLGFEKLVTVDDLRHAYPFLDWMDRDRWSTGEVKDVHNFPAIEAILLLGEPLRWETNLQLIVDILLTNGKPNQAYSVPENQLPVLAVNMDLHYMAKAAAPRLGHGAFLVCLEALYKKLSGSDLVYTALIGKPSETTFAYSQKMIENLAMEMNISDLKNIYFVGDNPMTDIYGSNVLNKLLSRKQQNQAEKSIQLKPRVKDKSVEVNTSQNSLSSRDVGNKLGINRCVSILVCTGVYNPSDCKTSEAFDPNHVTTKFSHFGNRKIDHGHRDLPFVEEMIKPDYVVRDVKEAVEKIFELENFTALNTCDS